MTIFGTIYDTATNQGIPGASIMVADATGKSLNQGIAADNTGWFQLISPLLDQGNKILISSTGYTSALVDPSVIISSGSVGINPTAEMLSPFVVTPATTKKYLPYLVGGGILWALLSGQKKKGSVGAIKINPQSETLLIGAGVVLVGGYFLVKKLIPGLNPFPAATNPVDVTQTAAAQAAALAQAKAQANPTYSADQYMGWANDIYKQGTASTVNQSVIVNDVVNVNNMTDLQSLISAFGTKQAGGTLCANFNMYCDTYDLPSFLKTVLDTVHINNINQYLSAQGINYTF